MEIAYRVLLIIQAILISFGLSFFRRYLLWTVIVIGLVESLIGFLQVIFQGSVGWHLLGEPHLDILNREVAKTVVSGGGRFLRAYGTFVHPNVLGAFLVICLLCLIYLFLNNKNPKLNCLFVFILFFLILGLILAFSRAAWLVGALVLGFWLAWEFFKSAGGRKNLRPKIIYLTVIMLTIVLTLVYIFHWVIFPKLYLSSDEPAIHLRMNDLKFGWQSVIENPFFGVGLGRPIYPGQQQPIHNLYLLIANEIGLVGLSFFLFFIILIIRNSFEIRNSKLEIQIIILLAILLLGMFDHYFWTIPAGQLMLWITIFGVVI